MKLLLLVFVLTCSLARLDASEEKVHALYRSLDPQSIPQSLAFYQLYPHYPEGELAKQRMCQLLGIKRTCLNPSIVNAIIQLVIKQPMQEAIKISSEDLTAIETMAAKLPNRNLRGHDATSEAEVLQLKPEEIDLARALFLFQLGDQADCIKDLRYYEAAIDLMALQILTRISMNASPKDKIAMMNHFIFDEMGFRFPPQSTFGKDIDRYTFLTSVIDSRRGVCLGVSILYLCLAQRLNLSLEMITPPGHIYIRYRSPTGEIINIETTARGVHLDCEEYLSVETKSLQQRNLKDVVGLAFVNEGAVYLRREEFSKTYECYQTAKKFLGEDAFLKQLMAITALLTERRQEGEAMMKELRDFKHDFAVVKDNLAEDYLNGDVDTEGLKFLFADYDDHREALLEKKQRLDSILKTHPKFRAGLTSLASTWAQLHRMGEALEVLSRYHSIDATNPTIEYYLAVQNGQRMNYQQAWQHLQLAEKITASSEYYPRELKEFRSALAKIYPE